MVTVIIANGKGGCGKTTIAHHLCQYADQEGIKVFAVDADEQHTLYRRCCGDKAEPSSETNVRRFGDLGRVSYQPKKYVLPKKAKGIELVIVDAKGDQGLPVGPTAPDYVVIPIDGNDAAREAKITMQSGLALGAKVILVLNNITVSGPQMANRIRQMRTLKLPKGASFAATELPTHRDIKATQDMCEPAWTCDPYGSAGSLAMKELCDELLNAMGFTSNDEEASNG